MKIDKKQFTYHGYLRIKERSNISEKEIRNLSVLAIRNGIGFTQIPPGSLKSYVGSKEGQKKKRVKLYRGYVFIFFLNSKRLITCYPIPEKHLKEYNELVKNNKRRKRRKWKSLRLQ